MPIAKIDHTMNLKKNEKILGGFLLLLTVLITFSSFINIGFTTADDLSYYMTFLRKNYFADAWNYARYAGRFYFIITKPLYSIVYAFDNFYFTKILQYGCLILSYSLFSFLIFKLFRSEPLAYVTFLLLIAATTITPGYHIPVISYPCFFTFSFSLMLVAILLFISFLENKKKSFLYFSAVLFFIVLLFYETYVIFLALFCLIVIIRSFIIRGFKNSFRDKNFYKETLPYIIAGGLYVTLYFVFRIIFNYGPHPEIYEGSRIASNFSFKHFIMVICNCNLAAIPGKIYEMNQDVFVANSLLPNGHIDKWGYLFQNLSVISWVNILILCFLFFFIFLKMDNRISWKKIAAGIIIASVFTLSSHVLLGIAEKYNSIWYSWLLGYVTTYFSWFGIIMVIVLIFYALYKIGYEVSFIRYGILLILTGIFLYFSVIIQYTNEHLSRDWQHSQNRFIVVDKLIQNHYFDNLPDQALVFAPDLYNTSSVMGKGVCEGFNWGKYIFLKSHKKININIYQYPDDLLKAIKKNPHKDIFYLQKNESLSNQDLFMALSKVEKSSINWTDKSALFTNSTCNEAEIFYYSPIHDYILNYNMISKQDSYPTDTASCSNISKSLMINNPKTDKGNSILTIKVDRAQIGSFNVSTLLPSK